MVIYRSSLFFFVSVCNRGRRTAKCQMSVSGIVTVWVRCRVLGCGGRWLVQQEPQRSAHEPTSELRQLHAVLPGVAPFRGHRTECTSSPSHSARQSRRCWGSHTDAEPCREEFIMLVHKSRTTRRPTENSCKLANSPRCPFFPTSWHVDVDKLRVDATFYCGKCFAVVTNAKTTGTVDDAWRAATNCERAERLTFNVPVSHTYRLMSRDAEWNSLNQDTLDWSLCR